MENTSILWRRLDKPGHEAARLLGTGSGWNLAGTAVFAHEGQPVRLDYMITLDANWKTVSAIVAGWVAGRSVHLEVAVDQHQRWTLNGDEVPGVKGCIDVDLNFSPSTNLLPIRRLALPIGQQASVRTAWLRFPSFKLELLEQIYTREAGDIYTYESGGGRFTATLRVNESGFVTDYADLWIEERGAASQAASTT